MANSLFVQTLPDSTNLQKGTGTATATPSGVLHVNTTQAGTIADTNETTLATYSMPANTLSADLKSIRITVTANAAANGNNKTVRIRFGGTSLVSTGAVAANGTSCVLEAVVRRTGAAAQNSVGWGTFGTSVIAPNAAQPTIDTTAAIDITVTGTNGTANANDIVLPVGGFIVEALN